MPDLSDRLAGQYAAAQWGVTARSEYLGDPALVNARIAAVVAGARSEILAAQPGGPRTREHQEIAVGRDTAALERGVKLRTLYRDTVRTDGITAEFARTMTGLGAEYRTVVCPFAKTVIVDREHAFVTNYVIDGPENAAWHVTDRAVVAWMAHVYEEEWRRADPWAGELRSRRGEPDAGAGEGDARPTRTTPQQREIMRLVVDDAPQSSIAKRLGISERRVSQELAALKALFGVGTLGALGFRWASCPDRLVDDSAPATDAAGADDEQDGVAA